MATPEAKPDINRIVLTPSGNCNFAYLSGLRNYKHENMLPAMKHALSSPDTGIKNSWSGTYVPVAYRSSYAGMWLFAQESNDETLRTNPYGPAFADLIEKLRLGQVIRLPGVPNVQHHNMKGYVFAWIRDTKASNAWWIENVQKHDSVIQAQNAAVVVKQQLVQEESCSSLTAMSPTGWNFNASTRMSRSSETAG